MKESYDDVIGCIVQSLNDNFIDHCYSTKELMRVISRWRKEGKRCFLYKKFVTKYNELDYYKLIPVECNKQLSDKSSHRIKKIAINYSEAPENYQISSGTYRHMYLIKDYESDVDEIELKRAIKYLEYRDNKGD